MAKKELHLSSDWDTRTGPSTTIGQGFDNFWPDGRGKKSCTQHSRWWPATAWKAGASCMTRHVFHGDAVSKEPQQQSKLRQPPKELCEFCHSQSGTTKQLKKT